MSPHAIQLMTDSTCDIPQDLIEKYEITVLPQIIIWGREEYRDRVTLQPQELFERLKSDRKTPTTAHATLYDFHYAYNRAIQQGAEAIVVITLSSALSGTIIAAQNAAKMVDIPVYVLDSKGTSMGLGWQVLAAARSRSEGGDAQAMIDRARRIRGSVVLNIAFDTADYFLRGGRAGNARRLIATMLKIKPLVWVNHETGVFEPDGIARTHKNAIEMLMQKFFERMDRGKPLHIAVLHGNAEEEARKIFDQIRREYNPVELLFNSTGTALGINSGPGALGLSGYSGK